jgi:cation transporter-like permease
LINLDNQPVTGVLYQQSILGETLMSLREALINSQTGPLPDRVTVAGATALRTSSSRDVPGLAGIRVSQITYLVPVGTDLLVFSFTSAVLSLLHLQHAVELVMTHVRFAID